MFLVFLQLIKIVQIIEECESKIFLSLQIKIKNLKLKVAYKNLRN